MPLGYFPPGYIDGHGYTLDSVGLDVYYPPVYGILGGLAWLAFA
jgi:hypothetical protein